MLATVASTATSMGKTCQWVRSLTKSHKTPYKNHEIIKKYTIFLYMK